MCILRIVASTYSSSEGAMRRLYKRRRDDTASWLRNTAACYKPLPTSWIRYKTYFKQHL